MRRGLIVLGVLLTACGGPQALAGNYPTTTTTATTTTATTTPREVTTTTHAPTTTAAPTTTQAPTTTAAPTTTQAPTTTAAPTTSSSLVFHKVFVCKYVGTPGVDERLQTGQNPIDVDIDSLEGPPVIGQFFQDKQGRSVVIAFDVGQPEPDVSECPIPNNTTTTTSQASTTTSSTTSSTAPSTTTTTIPTPTLFAIEVAPLCPDGTTPQIAITFGDRPDLDGQTGTLTFSTGGSIPLTFDANNTVDIAYPASAGTGPVTMTYTLGAESVTRSTSFPEACTPATTTTGVTTSTSGPTTTTSLPPTSTSSTSVPSTTSSTTSTVAPTTTLPETFTFGAAATVCIREVPTIEIVFRNQFPSLAGQTGTLTMADVNGNVVSTQSLVYEPGTTVHLLYPGTRVNPDGSIADVPGWNLNSAGFWVRDPSDEFLRDGINLTYTVNPTATAFVTYPPESSACANPPGPFPPSETVPTLPGQTTVPGQPPAPGQPGGPLPRTGNNTATTGAIAALTLALGSGLLLVSRRRKSPG